MASFERFTQVMDEHPDIQDVKDAKKLKVGDGTVQFDHVSFSYENSAEVILKDVDITVPPGGSTYALVGESGAGKSTFASLIPPVSMNRVKAR